VPSLRDYLLRPVNGTAIARPGVGNLLNINAIQAFA
jgi:hypothetical protein